MLAQEHHAEIASANELRARGPSTSQLERTAGDADGRAGSGLRAVPAPLRPAPHTCPRLYASAGDAADWPAGAPGPAGPSPATFASSMRAGPPRVGRQPAKLTREQGGLP
jgi:hypothetical protein